MRLAAWLLATILPRTDAGRSTLGDLLEEYHRRPRGLRRGLWFWTITADVLVRYIPVLVGRWTTSVARDLIYAARLTRRFPSFVIVAIVSLGVAIGGGTAAFSVANGSWMRSLRAADPSVVEVWRRHKNGASMGWPVPEAKGLERLSTTTALQFWAPASIKVSSSQEASTPVNFVSGDFLSILGARPAMGRLLEGADDRPGAEPVIVVSNLYWRRQLGGDPAVVGKRLDLSGITFAIAGVANRDFLDPYVHATSMWLPLSHRGRFPEVRLSDAVAIVGRLRSGVTVEQANAELASIAVRVSEPADSGLPPVTGAEAGPAASAQELSADRLSTIGLLSVIALVLVLASTNVANLQLAGAAARRQEIAVRVSCGASRARILRQLLTESLLLSATSAVLGLLLARWLAPALAAGMGIPTADVDPDSRVYLFVAGAAILTAIGTGLVPARHTSRRNISSDLKRTSRTALPSSPLNPRSPSSSSRWPRSWSGRSPTCCGWIRESISPS